MRLKLNSEYLTNIYTLVLGVGSSQLISVGAMLLYTRLYPPAYLGLLAMFFSLVILLRLPANGGFEAAILLPEKDVSAFHLLLSCFGINVVVVGIACLGVLFADVWIPYFYKESGARLQQVVWLLPISLFFEAGAIPLKYWLNRFKKYRVISRARFWQAVATAVISLTLGWQGYLLYGLLIGFVLGQVVQWTIMLWGSDLRHTYRWSWSDAKAVMYKYRQFSKYGVSGTSLNALASEIPFIILPAMYGEAITGMFHVARRVLFAPINLIAASVSTVFFQMATQAYRKSMAALQEVTRTTLWNMCWVSIVPSLIVFCFAAPLFAFVFGAEYRLAGIFASLLMPWVFVKFVCHPLACLVDIRMRLKAQLLYNFLLLSLQAGALYYFGNCCAVRQTVLAYGVAGFVCNTVYLGYLTKLAVLW